MKKDVVCVHLFVLSFNLKCLGSFKKNELLRQLLNYNHIYSVVVSQKDYKKCIHLIFCFN